MRWFRRKPADSPALTDPVRQEALIADIRHRFGGHVPVRFQEQADALAQLLGDDDGLAVAARIVQVTADRAYADVQTHGYVVDRRNYRILFRQLGLGYQLTEQSSGFHPYVHLAAALTAVEADVKRAMTVTDPNRLLVHLLELLDVTVSGWEFGRLRVGADDARLASHLIAAATRMRLTEDEPPALPPGIREVMRSNRTADVHDDNGAVIGGINVGAETRRAFLT